MQHNKRKRIIWLITLVFSLLTLFSFSAVYAEGNVSDIEYDDNSLTPTEQQGRDSGSTGWWPWEWNWGSIGDFLGDLWDGFVEGLSNFWEGTKRFFSDLGSMIADLWNSLPDWAQDLIITIGLIIAAVVVIVLLIVAGAITLIVGIVAIVVAALAGLIYFFLFGGTEAFNWLHAAGWIFGGALLGGLVAFLAQIGALGAMFSGLWAGLRSLGGTIWGWLRGLGIGLWGGLRSLGSAVWSGLRSLGNVIWGGLKVFGAALWNGLRSFGRGLWNGLRSLGQGLWNGLKALGGALWNGLRSLGKGLWNGLKSLGRGLWSGITTVGGWVGKFIKLHFYSGLFSMIFSIAFNLIGYRLGFKEFDPISWGIDALTAFGVGLLGGPIASSIKNAFLARSWGTLTGWVAGAGLLGGTGELLAEYFKTGKWSLEKFAVGGIISILVLPIPASLVGIGDFISIFATNTAIELAKWTYDTWLANIDIGEITTWITEWSAVLLYNIQSVYEQFYNWWSGLFEILLPLFM